MYRKREREEGALEREPARVMWYEYVIFIYIYVNIMCVYLCVYINVSMYKAVMYIDNTHFNYSTIALAILTFIFSCQ